MDLPLAELLELSKRLERCWSLGDILNAVSPTVDRTLGYPHTWLAVFGQVPGFVTVVSHAAVDGDSDELLRRSNSVDIPIAGDPFLAEILASDHVVVVEDAVNDPRTNKQVVAALGNQTIINVPLLLADQSLGTLGLGTFGPEGIRPPLPWHLDFLAMIAGHVAVALDRVNFIAQQQRTEEALSREKEHLRVTLESIGDAVVATGLDGVITRINPTAARLLGVAEVEALGRPLEEVFRIVNASTSAVVENPVKRVLSEGTVVGLANHATLLAKDGRQYQIADSAAPIRDSWGAMVGVVLVFRDVTEDYRLRQELDRTSALLEQTAAVAQVGGWEWDVAAGRFRWSAEALRLLGIPAPGPLSWDEVVGIVAAEKQADFGRAVASLLGQASPLSGEYSLRTLPGGNLWVRLQGVAVTEEGRVVRAYGTLQNLTAEREADERRRLLELQLFEAQKMESLGLLAGGVAHDMNNTLAAISGIASVSLLKPGVSGSDRTAFSTILAAIDRGRALTSRLLSVTRRSSHERTSVDWNVLVEQVCALLAHSTLNTVELVRRLDRQLPHVDGDPSALEQVLMNLCINAVDAMEASTSPRRLTITTRSAGNEIVVEVEDNGVGMSVETLGRAREPLFTTKPQGRGTGLGLALAASTLESHGGRMELDSELGKGTTVRLVMPVVQETVGRKTSVPLGDSPRRVTSVLVVDDDDLVRDVTIELLGVLGVAAAGANSAEAALELLKTGAGFDLVLLDVNMPGMGGAGALRRLRAQYPTLPVVLTTGLANQDVLTLVEQIPHTRLLAKPFVWEELRTLMGTT